MFQVGNIYFVLQDSELTNAGYGSNLTEIGQVECDASVMDTSQSEGVLGVDCDRISWYKYFSVLYQIHQIIVIVTLELLLV